MNYNFYMAPILRLVVIIVAIALFGTLLGCWILIYSANYVCLGLTFFIGSLGNAFGMLLNTHCICMEIIANSSYALMNMGIYSQMTNMVCIRGI
jgi:hypothetical protein